MSTVPSNPTPPAQVPGAPKMTRVNVPYDLPEEMLVADPKTGKMPIDDYQFQLLPKDAIVTNQEEVRKLVEQIRQETLPQGMKVEIADSPAGLKAAKGKQLVGQLANMAGGMSVYSLMGVGGALGKLAFVPVALAGPLAAVGGGVGLMTGLEQTKAALDRKHYFESLKARGVEEVPVGQDEAGNVRTAKVDDLISVANDAKWAGLTSTAASGLMLAAGLGAPPVVAVGAVVLGLGAALFGMRRLFVVLGKALVNKVKDAFSKGDKADSQPQIGVQKAEKLPAGSAPAAAPAAPTPGASPAPSAAPEGKKLTPEQVMARMQELQAQLMSDPAIAQKVAEIEQLQTQAAQDPSKVTPEMAQRFEKLQGEVMANPRAAAAIQEIQQLQAALLNDPEFQAALNEAAAQQQARVAGEAPKGQG
ncbi:MAG TPA: YlbF family regulator [Candidatus Nitrosotenuis sp.]|jgi:hypothetical protein|nr:YlbF family regulator [Candidatus Nitrosotenuis sp.]